MIRHRRDRGDVPRGRAAEQQLADTRVALELYRRFVNDVLGLGAMFADWQLRERIRPTGWRAWRGSPPGTPWRFRWQPDHLEPREARQLDTGDLEGRPHP